MAKNKSGQSLKDAMSSVFAVSSLLVALAVAIVVYVFVMGNPENFQVVIIRQEPRYQVTSLG